MKLLRDHRLPPQLNRILQTSGLLRGLWWFETDVSELPIGPIFKGQAAQEDGRGSKQRGLL